GAAPPTRQAQSRARAAMPSRQNDGPACRHWQASWDRLWPSAARRALRVDVERIQRLARRHEQAVAFEPAEADVGGALWQRDAADWLAVGREYHDALEFSRPHAPAPPQGARRV